MSRKHYFVKNPINPSLPNFADNELYRSVKSTTNDMKMPGICSHVTQTFKVSVFFAFLGSFLTGVSHSYVQLPLKLG